jgi:hypothetical protein
MSYTVCVLVIIYSKRLSFFFFWPTEVVFRSFLMTREYAEILTELLTQESVIVINEWRTRLKSYNVQKRHAWKAKAVR